VSKWFHALCHTAEDGTTHTSLWAQRLSLPNNLSMPARTVEFFEINRIMLASTSWYVRRRAGVGGGGGRRGSFLSLKLCLSEFLSFLLIRAAIILLALILIKDCQVYSPLPLNQARVVLHS